MNAETPSDDLSSEQVRLWLTAHPEFLDTHPELLPSVSGGSGKVVTLEAGQLNVLRQKNEELSLKLDAMLEQIRRNERIHASFHRIQMRLVTAPNPRELLLIATGDPERLFDIHRATIAISNRHPGLWSLCAPLQADPDLDQRLFLVDHKQLADLLRDAPRPLIRVGQEGINREIFFGPASTQVRSEALIPLFTHLESGPEGLIGALNLGGATPNRFLPSDATDLLRDLADILGLCLARLANQEGS
ncbi:hypothetical protein SIID45300_00204 [Candidatus Magnetaquicoccaceae bacterium FCR-1]|uniref:DUF484 family protein n=1 Tax=Candidatus Magnetaquiglobus chichijimensis TaxID=3141448 RepID=A0ABQ0C4V1_9PROT